MFPEVHPSVGSDRGEESKDSSGGMTEHSHPQHWAFPISWVEPCTQDGNISIIPDLHRPPFLPYAQDINSYQLLSISGLRHGCKDLLSHQPSPCFSLTSPGPLFQIYTWSITASQGHPYFRRGLELLGSSSCLLTILLAPFRAHGENSCL